MMRTPASEGSGKCPAPDPATVRSIIAGISLAMFLSVLEQTIVGPALPTIGARLGDINALSWVSGAYLLSATVATPLFGKLSDIYGRRCILLTGISIFIVGSVACALAPKMWVLVAARAVQGIGGGSILPISHAIIGDMVPPKERARYQSRLAVIFMGASISGPLIGGMLTDHLHWSLIFWINLPIGVLALVISYQALARIPRNERQHALDWLGAGLMVSATLALMLAMTWAGVRYPWTSWPIAALIGGSALLWFLFAWRIMTAAEPFVPLTVLSNCTGTLIAAFFSIGALSGLSFFMPLYLQLSLRTSALLSGIVLIAGMGGVVLGTLVGATALARCRHYKRIPVAGLVVAIAALTVLAADPDPSLTAVGILLLLIGAGIGQMYPITTILVQIAMARHQVGIATGTLNFFRLLGGTIIVAALGAIVLADGTCGLTSSGAIGHGPTATGALACAGGPVSDLNSVFAWVFIAVAGCLTAAVAALLMVEERPLAEAESPDPDEPWDDRCAVAPSPP